MLPIAYYLGLWTSYGIQFPCHYIQAVDQILSKFCAFMSNSKTHKLIDFLRFKKLKFCHIFPPCSAGSIVAFYPILIGILAGDVPFITLRLRQNGRDFPDDIFKWIFLNEHVWISINISLKFVPMGPINNIPTLVQVMAWRQPGDKPLSEPMTVRLPMHICVTRPQWVKKCGNWQYGGYLLSLTTAFLVIIYQGYPAKRALYYAWRVGPFWQDTIDMTI